MRTVIGVAAGVYGQDGIEVLLGLDISRLDEWYLNPSLMMEVSL